MFNSLPYYPQLVLARASLETCIPDFPESSCLESAYLVSLLCPNLKIQAGTYTPTLSKKSHGHAWNYDVERKLYINTSLDMFQKESEEYISKISILHSNNSRFKEETFYTYIVNTWTKSLHNDYPAFASTLNLLGISSLNS